MKVRSPRVLVVDDDKYLLEVFKISLEVLDFEIEAISDSGKALSLISEKDFDLIFLDLKMQPIDGMQILKEVKKVKPETTDIIISGNSGLDDALKAVDLGAYHILQKPVQIKELQFFAKKAWEYHAIKSELRELKEAAFSNKKGNFITQNSSILNSVDTALKMAESNINILIRGESGTGKKLIAELVHQKSARSNNPFVVVNCNVPENLLEQELFGLNADSTNQAANMSGKLEEANGGTVYFDEIANMPLDIQAKLLRVIQEKEVIRMGSARAIPLEFRVIAATNRDLDEMVKQRLFKDDLLQRLNVIPILLPSLRDRIGDIPSLIDHFCSLHSRGMREVRFTERAMAVLQRYRWPGNIRELGNLVAFLYATSESDEIDIYDLPPKFSEQCSVVGKYSSADAPRLSLDVEGPFYERVAQFEKQVLSREYDKFKGNVSRMALALQMDRSHLHSKLRALGIHSKDRASAETFI
jgi:two-component system nitrogen regulation response regulator NtrX